MSDDSYQEGNLALIDGEKDPYLKIKINANLSLRNLFKNYGKVLFNYWYIMFPSFMIRPQSEFTYFLKNFESKAISSEFKERVFEFMETQEPSLFFLIR